MPARQVPLIGIPTCLRTLNKRALHGVSERYPNAVIDAAGCLPILIPAVGSKVDLCVVLDRLDGLLLTGSPSNVHPSQYGAEPSYPEILHDPERDATTLPLIREAVRRDVPILLPGRLNHRSRKDSPDGPYGPAHSVVLTSGGLLASLAGTGEIMVNSLHSQGIDRPAPRLRVEAVAPDGQIEAVSLPEARFVVGVQWHPEYRARENPFSSALFTAFARACRAGLAGATPAARAA
jgi:putative glutamine amidotransferase